MSGRCRAKKKQIWWEVLQRLGYTSKTPLPRHANADAGFEPTLAIR
jgi:hypothetical protein